MAQKIVNIMLKHSAYKRCFHIWQWKHDHLHNIKFSFKEARLKKLEQSMYDRFVSTFCIQFSYSMKTFLYWALSLLLCVCLIRSFSPTVNRQVFVYENRKRIPSTCRPNYCKTVCILHSYFTFMNKEVWLIIMIPENSRFPQNLWKPEIHEGNKYN